MQNMGEEDDIFAFLDGISGWAKTESERRGVQDLASAVAAFESPTEYKRDSSKGKDKKNLYGSDSDGDWNKSPRRDRPTTFKDKGRDNKDEAPRKYSCFLGNGPHRVFECPTRGKLVALVMKEQRHEEETIIASISLEPCGGL